MHTPRIASWLATGALIGATLACSSPPKKIAPYSPHEYEPSTEKEAVAELVKAMSDAYDNKYKEGAHAYRMAHAKSHGCLKAKFEVASMVPSDLKKGLFADPGRSYEAWVRFSNGAPEIEWDKAPATRGMAIKVLGVKGDKLLPDEPESQDFLMSNFPSFWARDVDTMVKALRAHVDPQIPVGQQAEDFWATLKRPTEPMKKDFKRFNKPSRLRAKNLLAQTFWSGLPISVAGLPVKYKVDPCPENVVWSNPHEGLQPNFLGARLEKRMEEDDACYDFKMQRFVSDEKTPVEDGTAIWPEDPAQGGNRYVTVAHLFVPAQEFDSYERKEFCENLSFSPWHSLPEHQPLGGLNRLRKRVYQESSRYRHQWNGTDASPKAQSAVK